MMSRVIAPALLIVGSVVLFSAPGSSAASEVEQDSFCTSFISIGEEANRVRGDRVDPLTVFLGVEVRCDEKLVEYGQAVLKPDASLRAGWRDRLEKNWSKAYCKPGSRFSDAIRNGWTIASIVRTSDGQEFRITASCHEAMA